MMGMQNKTKRFHHTIVAYALENNKNNSYSDDNGNIYHAQVSQLQQSL